MTREQYTMMQNNTHDGHGRVSNLTIQELMKYYNFFQTSEIMEIFRALEAHNIHMDDLSYKHFVILTQNINHRL